MNSWLWIVPVVTLSHAATAEAGTRRAGLPWWWDWPLGAAIAGISAAAAVTGQQLAEDDTWAWHVLASMATLAYVSRAPFGPLDALLQVQSIRNARIAASVLIASSFVVSLSIAVTAAGRPGLGVAAGVLPSLHVGVVHARDHFKGIEPKRRPSPPPHISSGQPRSAQSGTGILGDIMRPVVQPWDNLNHRTGTTVY